ncbi:protein YrbN [Pluralibacter gergoviae]|uniref:Protein YrbN n=1 Tax=Pluralibacter gergoviae TaxID=61647 RepID=A0AAI9DKG0_PLUGE|nr:protein YrbN [Pluralibacter gergoviae]EKT9641209.1 protein YrbN [Pluralibacter gergoviae]EKV0915084.1 protein YrbN [Pluralibacter gergoviae]EKV0931196.1 protein YrbN [Pluralibacter gergoviae]EKV3543785.1 protein YrbN [Pluralibacter gergoviae]EKV6246871.1 protein YrbN [Pluralibacter gergoviae]
MKIAPIFHDEVCRLAAIFEAHVLHG